jgi:tetratricopeptide (TPR) repeat protein
METNDFSYFIERFNEGKMSDAEKKWFLKELEGNEKLRREVKLRKSTDEILKKQNVMALRNKLSEIEKQRNEAANPSKVKNKIGYIKYAAAFTGMIIIGSLIIFPGKTTSNEDIVKKYYKVYEASTNQRSVSQTATDADFTLALEYYNTHDYDKAEILFSKVLEKRPNDMQSALLKGVSNFEEKKYPDAKQSFVKVIDDKNNLYIDQAKWYLALCYLNTNETIKAKELFKIIENESGIYQADAKKIVRSMKK